MDAPRILIPGVPMPPSSNQIYANNPYTRGRGRFKTKVAHDWIKEFAAHCLKVSPTLAVARQFIARRNADTFITLDRIFYFKRQSLFYKNGNLKKNDAENRLKLLSDELARVLHCDDTLFKDQSFHTRLLHQESEPEYVDLLLTINCSLTDYSCQNLFLT